MKITFRKNKNNYLLCVNDKVIKPLIFVQNIYTSTTTQYHICSRDIHFNIAIACTIEKKWQYDTLESAKKQLANLYANYMENARPELFPTTTIENHTKLYKTP